MGMYINTVENAFASAGTKFVQSQEISQHRNALRQQQIAVMQTAEQKAFPENREKEDFQTTAADLERIVLTFNKKLKFVVDHESHEVIVKVIDSETDKVIKVLPPEELQRLHRKIKETIGFLFDERV
jgi:flagellar protein FlaG